MVQTTSLAHSSILRNSLSKRFPHFTFSYLALEDVQESRPLPSVALIAELKSLTDSQLSLCDHLLEEYADIPKILILTPSTYHTIWEQRKSALDACRVILSETKSLDYLLELPRLVEEISRHRRLKWQNERLQRLLEQHPGGPSQISEETDGWHPHELIYDWISQSPGKHCGLRIQVCDWQRLDKELGRNALLEVVENLSLSISEVVRGSDQIFHSAEDEFTILFTHTEPAQLIGCKTRLEKKLDQFKIKNERKSLPLPYQITTLQLQARQGMTAR